MLDGPVVIDERTLSAFQLLQTISLLFSKLASFCIRLEKIDLAQMQMYSVAGHIIHWKVYLTTDFLPNL